VWVGVLGLVDGRVVVRVWRMGAGFGGAGFNGRWGWVEPS
jgi:hypothetical protein